MLKYTGIFVAASIAFGFAGIAPAFSSDHSWMTQFKFNSVSKKMRRKGMYPLSAQCRNSPKAKVTIRPEIKVVWRKNAKNRAWALYMYKGQLDFRPGPPAQWNKWRRAYSKIIKSGAAAYRCSLFLKK